MTQKEFENQYCSNCRHKMEKIFDKCKPFVTGANSEIFWVNCSLFEPIKKEEQNGSRS